jgi:chromate transporter
VCFVSPAILITLFFAHLYITYGSLPQFAPVVAGMRPAIIAVILGAVYRLGKPLVRKSLVPGVIGLLVASLSLVHVNEIALLFAGGLAGVLWKNRNSFLQSSHLFSVTVFLFPIAVGTVGAFSPSNNITSASLGLFLLKIGSVLYGSGYLLVAFLQGGLVETRHWLTQTQLLDAIAVGQFTPGPVLSTAAFIGYVLLGFPGATVATIGIFLPSFIFVLILGPFVSRIRNVPSLGAFLDGVNGSALGLMLAVCITLGATALTNPLMWLIFLAAGILILKWKIHPAWLVAGSAALSWLVTVQF